MASAILTQYKTRLESLVLEPSTGGCFELTVGDELIYSKLQTGSFPDEADMVDEVGKRL